EQAAHEAILAQNCVNHTPDKPVFAKHTIEQAIFAAQQAASQAVQRVATAEQAAHEAVLAQNRVEQTSPIRVVAITKQTRTKQS
ncbi:hypothetical protein G0P98_28060, partial [Yangia sp. PrR004]|nr:hypothetical protein [Salipiger sp. PrR004]